MWLPIYFFAVCTCFVASVASADRAVLVRPTGADEMRADDLEEVLAEAIRAAEHSAVTERAGVDPDAVPPTTANEMRAVADLQNATYVVAAEFHEANASSYRLHIRVGYAPTTRVEAIDVAVPVETELPRLTDVLRSMLRPEGLGEDALRLAQDPTSPVGDPAAAAAAQAQAEADARAEAEAQAEFLRREQERQQAEHESAEEAWRTRERYGQPKPWMVSAGIDIRPLVAFPSGRNGGVLGSLSFRLGRSFEGLDGFEVRAAVDLTTGAQSGFAVGPGAVYMFSPFADIPLHFGASLELGLAQAISGNRVPSFFTRIAPIAAWRMIDEFYLEATLLEVQVLTASGGFLTLGGSVRAAYRF